MSNAFARQRREFTRAAAVAGVSFGQLAPGFFLAAAVPLVYREQGFELRDLWLFFVPQIPAWLKFLWGPLVDRYTTGFLGLRKNWIVSTTALATAIYASISLIQPTLPALHLLLAFLIIRSVATSLMDVAIDAYTVEQYQDNPRLGAGVVALAEMLGPVIASSLFLVLLDSLGWTASVLLATAVLVTCTVPVLLRKEEPYPRPPAQASLRKFIRRPDAIWIMIAAPLGVAAAYFPMLGDGLALKDKGLSLSEVGLVTGLGQAVGLAVGTAIAPWLLGVLRGARWPVVILLGAAAPAIAGAAVYGATELPVLIGLFGVAGVFLAPFFVAISAKRMEWASGGQVATDFSIQSALARVGYTGAGACVGFSAAAWGWSWHYVTAVIVVMLGGAVFALLSARIDKVKRALEAESA